MIQEKILELTEYGLVTGLVAPEDKRFTINRLLELFQLDELKDEVAAAYEKREPMTQETAEDALEGILTEMLDYAAEQGLMPEDTITYRDLFDTKIMSMLVPRPSEVIKKFQALYQISPKEATDYFYKLSRDTNYIRRYRIKKRPEMDCRYRVWNIGYHHQPLQTGKRSKGDCGSQACKTERLSEMPSLQRE